MGGKKVRAEYNLPGYIVIISSRLSQLQVKGVSLCLLLMKYISLLYLYPLRSYFFFYKLISDIVPLGCILQTGSDSAPLQVISHNDLWMKDISDQGKQESSVQKNKSTALILFFSFPDLQGICEGNCSFMHILQMGKHPEGPESLSKTRVNQN